MSIDKSGKWWVGSEIQDIKTFLESYAPQGFEVDEFRKATCSCGETRFYLEADDEEGFAVRICTSCDHRNYICDSEEYDADAKPVKYKCIECGSSTANMGVGFSLYGDDGEIRWLYVGVRCTECGVLGCFAGWKIAYSPSKQLMEHV